MIRLDGGVVRVRGENKKKEWHIRRMPAADKESSGIARGIPGVFDHRTISIRSFMFPLYHISV